MAGQLGEVLQHLFRFSITVWYLKIRQKRELFMNLFVFVLKQRYLQHVC